MVGSPKVLSEHEVGATHDCVALFEKKLREQMVTQSPVVVSANVFWDNGHVTTHLLVELSPNVATPFKVPHVFVHLPVELSAY